MATDFLITGDIFEIPASLEDISHKLIEVPLDAPLPSPYTLHAPAQIECREVNGSGVELPGPITLIPVYHPTALTSGHFQMKSGTIDSDDTFRWGYIRLSKDDAGRRFKIVYVTRRYSEGELYRDLRNIRSVGSEMLIPREIVTVPTGLSAPYSYRLIEVPLFAALPSPYIIHAPAEIEVREVDAYGDDLTGPVTLTPVYYPDSLLAGTFQIKANSIDSDATFKFGWIKFHQSDGSRRFRVVYKGRGSLVFAEDVTDLAKGYSLLDGAVRPAHISDIQTDDFSFPRHVHIYGDLNIHGIVNRDISEVIETTDEFLELHGEFTGPPTVDCGIFINRGDEDDAYMQWDESLDRWEFTEGGLNLPDGDLNMNLNQAVDFVVEHVADQPTEDVKVAAPALGGQLIYRTDTNALKVFNAGSSLFETLLYASSIIQHEVDAVDVSPGVGQTVFNLPWTFTGLWVFYRGQLMREGATYDYTITGAQQVIFNTGRQNGAWMMFVGMA